MRSIEEVMKDVHRVAKIYPAGSGHFVYTSGMHGDGYVDYRPLKAKEYTVLLREVSVHLLRQTVLRCELDPNRGITVIGPQTMGTLMVDAITAADMLGELEDFAELNTRKLNKHPDDEDAFVWDIDPQNVLLDSQIIAMDDLLNTGKTLAISARMVEEYGASISAVATIGDRCNVSAEKIGARNIVSLEEHSRFTIYHPDDCALCLECSPIVLHPGHGHNFQKEHVAHPGGFIESPE